MIVTLEKLNKLREPLEKIIHTYEGNGLIFGNPKEFQLTPEKGYTAKTTAQTSYQGRRVEDLVIVVLQPGDGTGSESGKYNLGKTKIPKEYLETWGSEKPWRFIPRPKDNVFVEGYFPLFSTRNGDQQILPYTGCLAGLTIRDDKLVEGFHLGQSPLMFASTCLSEQEKQKVYLTVMNDGENIFGNPHAIMNNQQESLQFGGFLAIPRTEMDTPKNQLIELAKTWEIPSQL